MSEYGKYLYFDISTDLTIFRFTSNGPKGEINKIIQFNKTETGNMVTLSFGNLTPDASIDDTTVNDNKDRNKILGTIADAIYKFSTQYPDTYISFVGSTPIRTRLYRMAISINLETEFIKMFDIWGLSAKKKIARFKKDHNYIAFLIKKK